jgi:hypothetical protein
MAVSKVGAILAAASAGALNLSPGDASVPDAWAVEGDPDTARVIALVSSIPMAVDLADYALAERAFAPKVQIDYTSLWGGSQEVLSPSELVARWRAIVPGFTATWHELSQVSAVVTGDDAAAIAFVDGRHWIGPDVWRPVGWYYWRLVRAGERWQVTSMRFELIAELGDRSLAAQAMEAVATTGVAAPG